MKAPESFQFRTRASVWLATLVFLLLLPAASAQGARIVVAQDGSGDAQTIAGGVAMALATFEADTVEVRPGDYDESVELGTEPGSYGGGLIVATDGPQRTRVRELTFSTGASFWRVDGLWIQAHVVEHGSSREMTEWSRCIFQEGYTGEGREEPNLTDCEFRGRTRLEGFGGGFHPGFTGLRFVGAHLDILNEFSVVFEDCHFEGPVDTAVTPYFRSDYSTIFRNCTFKDADLAIAPRDMYFNDHGLFVEGCSFENIRIAAIRNRNPEGDLSRRPLYYWIRDSRFENCGRAVDWHGNGPQTMRIEHTIVRGCRDTAIVTSSGLSVKGLWMEDNAGPGLFVRAGFYSPNTPLLLPVQIDSLFVRRSGGEGLIYVEEPLTMGRRERWIRNSEFIENGGPGALLAGQSFTIEGSLFERNRDAGLILVQEPGSQGGFGFYPDSVRSNTCVLNGSAGIEFRIREDLPVKTEWIAHHNLVAGNGGPGLLVEGDASLGTIAYNDAWVNSQGGYAGFLPDPSNLELDPRFCGVYNADYTVQESSPCAPFGPYGQIGAFGVGCASSYVEVLDLPGDPPTHSRGRLHVAMLGHRLLDPATVNAGTVRLGGAAPIEVGHDRRRGDVNHDGITDAIYAFRADEVTVAPTGTAEFIATTFGGSALPGSVQIREKRARPPIQPMAAGETLPLEIRSVAPNPSRGQFTIEFASPRGTPVEISIIDVAGRRIRSARLEERSGLRVLEVSGLQPGIYFAKVRAGAEAVSRRVVVR